MTRNDFLNGITEWYELLEFCNDNGCSICDDIISDDDRDDEIDSDIEDAIRNDRWYDIKGYLEEIPTGYSYYRRNSMFDYDGMDDSDFDEYKDDVLGWADREGDIWDEDPEENTEEDEDYDVFAEQADDDEDTEPAPEEEDFTVGELIGMCCFAFTTIKKADAQRAQEEEQRINQLYPKVLK